MGIQIARRTIIALNNDQVIEYLNLLEDEAKSLLVNFLIFVATVFCIVDIVSNENSHFLFLSSN